MNECINLPKCGFFIKYCETKNLACQGFITRYCKGGRIEDCERFKYKQTHGIAPPDNMMPTGQTIVEK